MKIITIALLLAAFVLIAVVAAARRRRAAGSADWPLYAKKPLSVPEQILYHRLVKTMPDRIVLAQVQLSRVLGVKKGFNFGQWNNRINRLSLDFVVCLKDSTVAAVIELDDSSHKTQPRAEADRRKEQALKSAGVTLIRWSVNALPDESTIRTALSQIVLTKHPSERS